jgi:uncharacterized lipoprotein YajG
MPSALDMMNNKRETGLDIISNAVPFLISLEIVEEAQSTATARPNVNVVAIELSIMNFVCSLNTNNAREGKKPIKTIAEHSRIKKIGSRRDSRNVFNATLKKFRTIFCSSIFYFGRN